MGVFTKQNQAFSEMEKSSSCGKVAYGSLAVNRQEVANSKFFLPGQDGSQGRLT